MPARRKPKPGQLALPILPVTAPLLPIVAVEAPWTIAPADAALGNIARYAQGQVFQHAGGFSLFFYRDRGLWALHRHAGSMHLIEPLTDESDPTQVPFDFAVEVAQAKHFIVDIPHYSQALRGAPQEKEEKSA